MKTNPQENDKTGPVRAFQLRYDRLALHRAMLEASVSVSGYFYAVDLGGHVQPRVHFVSKAGTCTCYLGELCPAADVVRANLAAGGEQAPDPPPGYYPVIPARCPVCHAGVSFDNSLGSPQRGAGWRCDAGGSAHYWQRMVAVLRWQFAKKHAARHGLPPPEPLSEDIW